MNVVKSEPVTTAGIVTGLISAAVTLGVLPSDKPSVAIALVTLLLSVLTALIARTKTTPYWKYAQLAEKEAKAVSLSPDAIEDIAKAVQAKSHQIPVTKI